MTTTAAIIAVALAVAAVVLHPAIIAVVNEIRQQRIAKELETTKKALEDEIVNGHNLARIVDLRSRVQKLQHDLDWW